MRLNLSSYLKTKIFGAFLIQIVLSLVLAQTGMDGNVKLYGVPTVFFTGIQEK